MNDHVVVGLCRVTMLVLSCGKAVFPNVPPVYEFRAHQPPRDHSVPRQVRWRRDTENRPLAQHRRDTGWVDARIGVRCWRDNQWRRRRLGTQESPQRRAWNNRLKRRDAINLGRVGVGSIGGEP